MGIGEIAHISSPVPGGPRHDPDAGRNTTPGMDIRRDNDLCDSGLFDNHLRDDEPRFCALTGYNKARHLPVATGHGIHEVHSAFQSADVNNKSAKSRIVQRAFV